MARDYRTLKLEILAETKQFVDDMKKSENQVEGFGDKMQKLGKVAAAAFAAAGLATKDFGKGSSQLGGTRQLSKELMTAKLLEKY